MSAKELRAKPAPELRGELLKLRKEQFALRMQRATGQGARPSEFARVRKTIARLKTVMREQELSAKGAKPATGAK
jgi:large subunit ribosomal protein L29